ncbi:MAG: sigma-54 dependent transcriptional regulator [Terracidiphilus sp.]
MRSLLVVLSVIRNPETRSFVRLVLEGAGHRVIDSPGYTQALSLLSNGLGPDLVLVEPAQADPTETQQYLQLVKIAPKNRICLIMGISEQGLRTEASELGIKYVLTKPLTRGDIETLIGELNPGSVHRTHADLVFPAAETLKSKRSIPADMPVSLQLEELGDGRFFLAASPQMLDIHRQVKLLADVDVTVLILGESGTGKEVIAHLIHKHSRRSRNKFVNVNCAALPTELLESELFGHQQGAFTGAVKDRAGKFEQANRGTLLLDEIGEMSAQMQAKLLHVLQDGQFTRLGAQECSKVDVRVLAATNVQMENALLEKTFREDLYYRLNAFTIVVPPLRQRREEIPYLIEETIRRTPAEMKTGWDCSFSSRLMDAAQLYNWKGNVRELRNFVTRTIIMRDLDAAVRELETKIAATSETANQEESISEFEQGSGMRSIVRDVKDRAEVQIIQNALDVSGWNRRHAAKHLNVSYRTLLYKIQRHRLTPKLAAERTQ